VEFKEVGTVYMQGKIKGLHKKKATAYDGIPPKMLQLAHKEEAEVLTKYVNEMIMNSEFPDDLKYANVCPCYKKKDRQTKENYRPISILTCISKIFEGVVADQM
jgi:hypothetical protein